MSTKRSSLADDYPRSIKIVSHTDQFTCNNGYGMRVVPPDDMLQVKELYLEIVFLFDGGITSNRKISEIAVVDNFPSFILDEPLIKNVVDKEFEADANGLLHISIDLTPYLVSRTGDNWVSIRFPDVFNNTQNYGTFLLWKLELVHTTESVRSKRS